MLSGVGQGGTSPESSPPRLVQSNIFRTVLNILRRQEHFSPRRLLTVTILGVALAEVFAMLIVYWIRDWPYVLQVIVDAAAMMVGVLPLLYYLTFKPLKSYVEQHKQADSILQARLRVMQYTYTQSLDELLQCIIDEIESLTSSQIGFFHFVDDDQDSLWLQTWSTNTIQNMCKADSKHQHYPVEQAGVWADAVRQRSPVIHNNFQDLPGRKGMPAGHAEVVREIVVPIIRAGKVVAILGVGDKAQDYSQSDLEIVSTLADFSWDMIETKRSEIALRHSEEKFRTLADWTYDWEKWLDPQGRFIYSSPSCERITGFTPQEFLSDSDLLDRIVHPDDLKLFHEHRQAVHDVFAGPRTIEYRIIAKDGSEHWIEHICRPLFGPDGSPLGRRISNRDVTERKRIEKETQLQRQKEAILVQTIKTIQADIARDLHDTLGQNVSYLSMHLASLAETEWIDTANIKNQVQKMHHVAEESYQIVRSLLTVLNTENLTDPLPLFQRYATQVGNRSSLQVDVSGESKPGQLTQHQIQQLFFIFKEALNNVEKHAQATHVACKFIWNENSLSIQITDNGCGFDLEATQILGHYGLRFMRERTYLIGGQFDIKSAPGEGVTIQVIVPFEVVPPS